MNCCQGSQVRYHAGVQKVNGKWADVYDVYHAHSHDCINFVVWDTLEDLPMDSQFARYLKNRW